MSDLLMFSARTYYRLIQLYNLEVWPLHLLAFAAGLALVLCVRRTGAGRVAAIVLGICWLWVAWAFHAERYTAINSAAPYFAAAFAVQGMLLIFAGRLHASHDRFGPGVLSLALLGYPLLTLLSGRPWQQAEMFGIAPDPTVAFTLALLALCQRVHWILWPVPLLWSAVSGATLWTMGAPNAWVVPLIALLALMRIIQRRRQRCAAGC
ncbi:DUF6064 family protein [Massilia polaris]|uniref:DUF6064 family protein n=1 Tax=Massilia polaris TaxID=2728846 RepID=UPI001E5BBCDF|nr:DUF6064 family protein [Massilia polaris]